MIPLKPSVWWFFGQFLESLGLQSFHQGLCSHVVLSLGVSVFTWLFSCKDQMCWARGSPYSTLTSS